MYEAVAMAESCPILKGMRCAGARSPRQLAMETFFRSFDLMSLNSTLSMGNANYVSHVVCGLRESQRQPSGADVENETPKPASLPAWQVSPYQ